MDNEFLKDGFICSERDLITLCNKWKRKLGLDAWDIRVSIVRGKNMEKDDASGTNQFSIAKRCAIINLIDPEDYPDIPFEYDMEVTLVHELLHIPLKYFSEPPEDSLEEFELEVFIDHQAKLLVSLSREIDKLMEVK